MASKKQITLTQHPGFKRRAAPDSDDDSPGDEAPPQQLQQQQQEAPSAANNDAEQPMMMQAAAGASCSNDNMETEEAAGNDEIEGNHENYELSQEEFDELTQQFGDHSYYDDEDEAKEQDSDAKQEEEDEPEDNIQHRDLTQEILESDNEEHDDDASENEVHGAPNKNGQKRKSRQSLVDVFVQPMPAKKRKLHRDTDNEVTIKMRRLGGTEKTFRKGEVYRSSLMKKLFKGKTFIIENFSGETTKYAECRVFVKFANTYAWTSNMDNFLRDKQPKHEYVFFKKTQTVRLQDLDEGPFYPTTSFPPKESETLVWHPNEKGNIGVGLKIAYGLSMEERLEQKTTSSPAASPLIIPCLELFAGAGGMSVGLQAARLNADSKEARLSVYWAVESDPNAATTWRMNHSQPPDPSRPDDAPICFLEDIRDWFDKVKRLEVPYRNVKPKHIHGSPPCQGFSRANRRANNKKEENGVDKENKEMTKLFFDVCLYFKPDTISMENVDNILSADHEKYLKEGMNRLIEADYQCVLLNISAASFGDPQERRRCILIAVKKTMPFNPDMLSATHGEEDELLGLVTPRNVLVDLEDVKPLKGGLFRLPTNGDYIYDHVEKGTNLPRTESGDLIEKEIVKLDGDKPAKTLTKSNRMQHYKHKDRGLTIRELARLQSFPDTFFFSGDVKVQRDQIGNAVPCKLAEAIGRFVLHSYVPADDNR